MKNQFKLYRGAGFSLAGILVVLSIIALLAALALPQTARAQLQSQVDTNALPIVSTNTFLLYGDQSGTFTNGQTMATPMILGTKTTTLQASVGGFFTNTTAAASNVTFTIYSSISQAEWQLNTNVVLVVPANTTNWVVGQFVIANAYPLYGLRTIANTNSAAVTGRANSQFFKVWAKSGM